MWFFRSYWQNSQRFLLESVRPLNRSVLCMYVCYDVQGYPQWMTLQRRLYGIITVCLLIFTISFNCKLVSFFAKSLNQPLKDNLLGKRLDLIEKLSYCMSFRLSLPSRPLWVTLYVSLPHFCAPTSCIFNNTILRPQCAMFILKILSLRVFMFVPCYST